MNNSQFGPNLKRKRFARLINEAHLDYLKDKRENPHKYAEGEIFYPSNTPNRNPHQVPDGTWLRLIYKHLHNHFYN